MKKDLSRSHLHGFWDRSFSKLFTSTCYDRQQNEQNQGQSEVILKETH